MLAEVLIALEEAALLSGQWWGQNLPHPSKK